MKIMMMEVKNMKLFYNHDAEGCILEGEKIDKSPVPFGPIILQPGTCINYMGDGRDHRSFSMSDEYTLEYVGMIHFGNNNEFNRLLFTVHDYYYFQINNLYYSFVYVNSKTLYLVRGPLGGMRDILLKNVRVVKNPVSPKQAPVQLTFFDLINSV